MVQKLLDENSPFCDELIKYIYRDKEGDGVSVITLDIKTNLTLLLSSSAKWLFIDNTKKTIPLYAVTEYFRGREEERLEEQILIALYHQSAPRISAATRQQKIDALIKEGVIDYYDGNLLTLARLHYKGLK